MICEKCGKELPDNAGLCTSCGWKSSGWELQKQQGKDRYKSIFTVLIVIPVAIFVLLISIIILISAGGQ